MQQKRNQCSEHSWIILSSSPIELGERAEPNTLPVGLPAASTERPSVHARAGASDTNACGVAGERNGSRSHAGGTEGSADGAGVPE